MCACVCVRVCVCVCVFVRASVCGLPWRLSSEKSACSAGATEDIGSTPGLRTHFSGDPTSVFLPGEFHGQRSLADYGP